MAGDRSPTNVCAYHPTLATLLQFNETRYTAPHPTDMQHPPEPGSARRKTQRLVDKLSKCIQYIKSPDGGGFRSFGDFLIQMFTELPSDGSSANDRAHQTVKQTVRAFLSYKPLKSFLDGISSHPVMMTRDKNTEGIVPYYSVSPGLSTSDG